MYIRKFESFFSDYLNDARYSNNGLQVYADYKKEILDYFSELTDEFDHKEIYIRGCFVLKIIYPMDQFEKFKDILHEGLFERFIEDHPKTTISFSPFYITVNRSRADCSTTEEFTDIDKFFEWTKLALGKKEALGYKATKGGILIRIM